jgi:glycosyltransferase involved in cell wall biosynthesis
VGDVAGLAAAAARILRDPVLAAQLGREGRERVEEDFSAERTATEVGRIIASTLRRPEPDHANVRS